MIWSRLIWDKEIESREAIPAPCGTPTFISVKKEEMESMRTKKKRLLKNDLRSK